MRAGLTVAAPVHDAPSSDAAGTEAARADAAIADATDGGTPPESAFPAYPATETFVPAGGPLVQAAGRPGSSSQKRPAKAQRISRAERNATVTAIVTAIAPPEAEDRAEPETAAPPPGDDEGGRPTPLVEDAVEAHAGEAQPVEAQPVEATDPPDPPPLSGGHAPTPAQAHDTATKPADSLGLLALPRDPDEGDAETPARVHTGRAKRFTVIGIVVMLLALVLAALVRPSTSAQASKIAPLHHTSAVVASSLTTTVQPPPTPDPSAPGLTVNSGEDQSDPVLFRNGGQYFLYTSGIPQTEPTVTVVNVPVSSSTDFVNWTPVVDALPTLPRWADRGFTWAPDVHKFGSTYVLYFTADVKGTGMQCIGVAVASSPIGPFAPNASPFICQRNLGGTIDPRVFTATDGTPWMLFKSDQNIGGRSTPTTLWSQRLSPDGLHLVGPRNDLMSPDERWQGTIVEAPDMIEVDGTYWIFYSANWFNQPAYGIGAARCKGPAGPCADITDTPLLSSNSQGLGPGEASVFTDGTGAWMLYSPVRAVGGQPSPAGGHHPDRLRTEGALPGRRRTSTQPRRGPVGRLSPVGDGARPPPHCHRPDHWWPSSPCR